MLKQKREGPMAKKYLVNLTEDERTTLLTLTKKGSVAARKLTRAHILLHADDQASDDDISKACIVGQQRLSGPASALLKRVWRQP
jgi:hypothetical protein